MVERTTDLPKEVLVNPNILLAELRRELHQLTPNELNEIIPDIETLLNELKSKPGYKPELKEGSIIVKFVNKCGPYGYRYPTWEYLGKAPSGVPPGTYAPSTPLRFKKRKQWIHVGDWSGKRIHNLPRESLVNQEGLD